MYPWESCPQHGEESTPGARPYTEDHVSADVALAFAGYVNATGDRDYARRIAWPVLRSVAELIVSRVVRTSRGLRDPAARSGRERSTRPVDNNAYTNMSAAMALRAAIECAALIGEPAPGLWQRRSPRRWSCRGIADEARSSITMAPGCRNRRAVSRRRRRPLPGRLSNGPRLELATYRYAAIEQAPLYVGAPMLSALLPVYAARAGEPALARRLLESGYGDFINDPSWSLTNTRSRTTAREHRPCSRT